MILYIIRYLETIGDTTINHFSFDIQFEKALTEDEMSNIEVFSGSLGNQSNDLNVTQLLLRLLSVVLPTILVQNKPLLFLVN